MNSTIGRNTSHPRAERSFAGFDLEEFYYIYPKQWLAVAVLEERQGRPVRGYLLAHSKDRHTVEEQARFYSSRRVLFFYTGERQFPLKGNN